MRRRRIFLAAWLLAMLPGIVLAYPEGAPWGAADPDAKENCSTCHFDFDATLESVAIAIDGLPSAPLAGETYELIIQFRNSKTAAAGFQLLARGPDDGAGKFSSTASAIEADEHGIRSTAPAINRGGVSWSVAWTAPESPGATIRFFLAVSGSNNDGSPFGDEIHFRAFKIRL